MRHLGLFGRFTLACIFALTQSLWAATEWRDNDPDLSLAYASKDANIQKFIDYVHWAWLQNVKAKTATVDDWKNGILPDLKDEAKKLTALKDDQPGLIKELKAVVAAKTFDVGKFKIQTPADSGVEARGADPCAGNDCGKPSDADPAAQPLSPPQAKPISDTAQALRDQRRDDQGPPAPADLPPAPRAPPVVVGDSPAPLAPAPGLAAGVSVQSNGGLGGLAALFGGGGGAGGGLFSTLLASMFLGIGGGRQGQFGGYGGGYYPYGAAAMYPGQYGYRPPMFGPGGLYGQGGAYSALGLPNVYRAPGTFGAQNTMLGAGFNNYGGAAFGAPAVLPYVSSPGGIYGNAGGSILGNNYRLPPAYPLGQTPPGVH